MIAYDDVAQFFQLPATCTVHHRVDLLFTPEHGVDIIAHSTQTCLLLSRDEGLLVESNGMPGGIFPNATEACRAIVEPRADLLGQDEVTDCCDSRS